MIPTRRSIAAELGAPDLSIVVPLPPQMANARRHWATNHRAKTRYWRTLDNHQQVGLIPPPPKVPWARAYVRAHLWLWNGMDEGNSIHRLKWLEDWLVTRGYLLDDRRSCLTWLEIPEQTITRKEGEQRVQVDLWRPPDAGVAA